MSLEGYEVWLIIILVLGVIASNIAVLKYSAKFKMPQFGEPKDNKTTAEQDKTDIEQGSADTKDDNSKPNG
ncbi:DUF2897 family protein [Shewanella ulleungensis]|jgi:hypothetical protein|uniref:DUF2897 family protein n=1 Tax=Shewanella ulleungensis TaxID=2282699 RepID=A0ABQ2QLQ8_9GAMM|nr:DUF2897 family protein [Shewanella ulleungensis]MCL1151759.1 DUF2897 family protein [Shewanella ulleungensis]GGP84300.1 hypothetical protein GCM10009410_17110 [Shewanella ulleungensis]